MRTFEPILYFYMLDYFHILDIKNTAASGTLLYAFNNTFQIISFPSFLLCR